MSAPATARLRLGGVGLLQMGALAAMGWVPGARGTPLPALALWALAFGAHLAAWRILADGRPIGERPANGDRSGSTEISGSAGVRGAAPGDRASRRIVWGVAIAGRLALLPLDPHFSDDLWRYLWDGWVGSHGVNPYLLPPAAEALDPLATGWRVLVNHPEISTIYPPGAQLVFHLLALLGPSALLFKTAWVVADLGVAAVVDRLARRRDDATGVPLLLWLWSPLVLVEVAWSGHLEPLGILPLAAALLFLGARRSGTGGGDGAAEPGAGRRAAWAGGALLGVGASVKLAPLLALPALLRRRRRAAALLLLLVPALLYLPYASAGAALSEGLGEYAARWRFNAALFRLLAPLGPGAARWIAAVLVAAVALGAAARRWTVERALFWTLGAALLLSPTIHPWYALWILPFAALRRSLPWVAWTGLLFMAYAGLDVFRATGRWPHPPTLAAAVHAPLVLLLVARALRRFMGSRRRRWLGLLLAKILGGREEVPGREEEGEDGARRRARGQDADPGGQQGEPEKEPDARPDPA